MFLPRGVFNLGRRLAAGPFFGATVHFMYGHAVVGIFSGLLQIIAIVPYGRETLDGRTLPNVVSWGIWKLEVLIALAAQWSAGASWSLLLLVSATVINITIVGLGVFGYGYKKFGTVETVCLSLSLLALLLWQVTQNPLVAIFFAIAADFIAYIPTLVKTYKEPGSETALLWFLLMVVGILSAVSSIKIDLANLAFPVFYASINLVVWGFVFLGQRLTKA